MVSGNNHNLPPLGGLPETEMKGLNWKEQMHWELYKQYLGNNEKKLAGYSSDGNFIHVAYDLSKLATEQFINHLAADARDELEATGWKEENFKAMVESYEGRWKTERNGDCYNAVERALSGKPLNH